MVSEFIYTVVLRPPPLRKLENCILRAIIPDILERHGAKIVLYLLQTVAADGAANVTCLRKAASDRAGAMTLGTSPNNCGADRLYANRPADRSCGVEVATIGELLRQLRITGPWESIARRPGREYTAVAGVGGGVA